MILMLKRCVLPPLYLSAGYKKGVRPVRNWRNCTMVAIDLMVYSILSDEKNQVLTTYVWYRQDFEDVNQMSVPIANVWVPDILINEFVDVGKSQDIPYVYVTHYGLVRNYKPIQLVTACTLNIYNFPFDIQNCSLTFQSWLHTLNDFDLKLMRSAEELKVDKSVFMNQGEWELLHVLSKYKSFSLDNIDSYAEMKFNVTLCNHHLHHTCEIGRGGEDSREQGLGSLVISSIRGILEKKDKCRDIAKEWLLVGYVLDVLLFRVYLVAMLAYSITLGSLWSMCQYA
uniref:5-hydroxytryptamine receptor 3A n=1 Tax=Oncorhynchus mykiss TaxID=8022 RepID=A0A8C7R257_ONCMY